MSYTKSNKSGPCLTGESEIYLVDITVEADVANAINKVNERFGRVHILVNCAGIAGKTNILSHEVESDNMRLVFDVNFMGSFYTSKYAIPYMLKNNYGRVLHIASISGKEGNAGMLAYSASKAAVEAMTKVWAKELGAFGIRSVAIAPGFIDTDGTHNALEEKMLNKWIELTPIKRTGKLNEIVSAVQFTIQNDFVNGEVIHVDGGLRI